jgi:hypothetical protein
MPPSCADLKLCSTCAAGASGEGRHDGDAMHTTASDGCAVPGADLKLPSTCAAGAAGDGRHDGDAMHTLAIDACAVPGMCMCGYRNMGVPERLW